MAREGFVDPLGGIYGPMLFPRTIRPPADVPVPADAKDLESIHTFMKSLEFRSPEKLMNEAKRIVDGGAELLESYLATFTENVGKSDAITAKDKDRPQERRPGLGRARKRAPFSLRTSLSHPSVSLEPTVDLDKLQDPDEFFNAYERMENAKKEIEKRLGGNVDNVKNYKPSNSGRRRREGILGKSYNYKHRYSSEPSENDILMSSPEMVGRDVAASPQDDLQEKLIHPKPIPDFDIEEVELAASMKKAENEVNSILEELLSCNNENLEGDGALNLLQDRLKIRPLDLENLCTTELPSARRTNTFTVAERYLGNTSTPTATESSQKQQKSTPVISNLNILSQKSMSHDQVANPLNLASPTPPRSPFASISSLQKRILQPYPLRDPFSPANLDVSDCRNVSLLQPKNKPLDNAKPTKDLGSSNELESYVEAENREPDLESYVEAQSREPELESYVEAETREPELESYVEAETREPELESNVEAENREPVVSYPLRDSFSPVNLDLSECRNDFPVQPKNTSLGQAKPTNDLGSSNELESYVEAENREPLVSKKNAHNDVGKENTPPEQVMDGSAGIKTKNVECRLNELESDEVEEAMNIDQGNSVPSAPENVGRDHMSSRKQTNREQQPEVRKSKPPKGGKVAGEKRIRNAHPMRKSLAEAGTCFESGVRRSKRIRMRPLEYWKGERFLYGRVNDSLKLIGVKYISPEKDNGKLKVKPYIPSDSSEFKELLELAARH
ncbi:centromere protein C [Andrographis paniculata]|uniref:centromere protein C n=1 Tax=Andrographis paniculata TaxID=175694 RepID=UPI0021E7093B|nr:centromere protein C [Andrographis paniculata]